MKGNQVVQFGISNQVETRLARHKRNGFTNSPIILIPFKMGLEAKNLESSLIKLVKEYAIPTCKERGMFFSGATEAFCLEDTDEDFLKEFMELVGQ